MPDSQKSDSDKEKGRELSASDPRQKTKRSELLASSPDSTPLGSSYPNLPTLVISDDNGSAISRSNFSPALDSQLGPTNAVLVIGNSAVKDRVLESGMTLYTWTVRFTLALLEV